MAEAKESGSSIDGKIKIIGRSLRLYNELERVYQQHIRANKEVKHQSQINII